MFLNTRPAIESLWQSQFLVTPKIPPWREVGPGSFRDEALPLIDEERFVPCTAWTTAVPPGGADRPRGPRYLKEMFNLTDDEALEQLEFNLLWHHALRLDIEETHLPQKTLVHNFRASRSDAARRWPTWLGPFLCHDACYGGGNHPGAGQRTGKQRWTPEYIMSGT